MDKMDKPGGIEEIPSGLASRASDTKSTATLFRSTSNAALKSKRPPGNMSNYKHMAQ